MPEPRTPSAPLGYADAVHHEQQAAAHLAAVENLAAHVDADAPVMVLRTRLATAHATLALAITTRLPSR